MTRLFIAILVLAAAANAQQNRIDRAVDIGQRHTFTGHLQPKARSENDQGRVLPSRTLSYVTLALAHSEYPQLTNDLMGKGLYTARSRTRLEFIRAGAMGSKRRLAVSPP